MKNLNLGDIVRYDKGDYLSYYFLIIEKQEITSKLHHAGYYVQYKMKDFDYDIVRTIASDNPVFKNFVRVNDWRI